MKKNRKIDVSQKGLFDFGGIKYRGFEIGDKVRIKPIVKKDGTPRKDVVQPEAYKIYTIRSFFAHVDQVRLFDPESPKAYIQINTENIEKVREIKIE